MVRPVSRMLPYGSVTVSRCRATGTAGRRLRGNLILRMMHTGRQTDLKPGSVNSVELNVALALSEIIQSWPVNEVFTFFVR